MEKVSVILVGWFLGSRNTTLLHRVAVKLESMGKRGGWLDLIVGRAPSGQRIAQVDYDCLRRA